MIIKTYEELKEYINAFSNNKFNLLIIKSKGGLSKSHLLKESVQNAVFFKGHATPLSVFLKLQENTKKLVVFDDVDELIKNKGNVSLLKQITETTPTKIIQYNSTSKILEGKKQSFTSENKVCLLVNDIKRIGHNMKALLTRGFYIDFIPSNDEIIKYLNLFAKDKEILSFLETNKDLINELNLRVYTRCLELKNANIDWSDWVLKEFCVSDEEQLIRDIKDLPAKERNMIWEEQTGKSIRTLRRKLK